MDRNLELTPHLFHQWSPSFDLFIEVISKLSSEHNYDYTLSSKSAWLALFVIYKYSDQWYIKLLESPIPAATASSQKAHFDDISGTKRGTIDPLVSKRPEKNSE